MRRGMTLYEVLIALAIFAGAMAVLGQAMSTGGRAATQAKLRSEAILRCEQKMGDIVAGVLPLQNQSGGFEDRAEGWSWDAQVQNGPTSGLMYVLVSVLHEGSNSTATVSYSMSRYLRDPQVFVIQQEIDAAIKEEQSQ